jgi:hypothetical protein
MKQELSNDPTANDASRNLDQQSPAEQIQTRRADTPVPMLYSWATEASVREASPDRAAVSTSNSQSTVLSDPAVITVGKSLTQAHSLTIHPYSFLSLSRYSDRGARVYMEDTEFIRLVKSAKQVLEGYDAL